MPRTNRITCAGCDKAIDGNAIHRCSNDLFRLFLSTRGLKKITESDAACRKCRSKYDRWLKKTQGDFGKLSDWNTDSDPMVSCFLFLFVW